MTIRLTNAMTHRKEDLVPLDPGNVRMYLCGPTVYDRAHIGNARNAIVFDVLFRLLRHDFGADHVTYVRNITDVDDKINARAAATGRSIREITDETIGWYHDDLGALGCLRPSAEPRATDHIAEMIAMIGALIPGHAYVAEGHVLFDVRSYRGYGALSGRSVDDMIAGARVEVAPWKRDPMDFVLWKPSDADQPGWDSPWGRGRPGWHIECSAMSEALLGRSFDIHGGGTDLAFPHHENERAQSMCAHPEASFAQVWLHNEMLLVEGRKMSKSLGNFFTIRDLLDEGVPGEVIRLVFLGTHYRKPMDWTEEKVAQAEATLRKWRDLTGGRSAGRAEPHRSVVDALQDDLNTPMAVTALHALAGEVETSGTGWNDLAASGAMLGLLTPDMGGWARGDADLSPYAGRLAELHASAMSSKDFTKVDAMKAALVDAGLEVRITRDGVDLKPGPGFDAARLETLE